jgi:glycosyltransferase involved in cell wall biosynthesis
MHTEPVLSRSKSSLHTLNAELLSIVVPCFNEAENVVAFHARTSAAISALNLSVEFIFVDDGSTDDTFNRVRYCSD